MPRSAAFSRPIELTRKQHTPERTDIDDEQGLVREARQLSIRPAKRSDPPLEPASCWRGRAVREPRCSPIAVHRGGGYAEFAVDLPREPDLRAIARRLVRARPGEELFDDEFWSSMTGEQRVEVTWLMTLETLALEGVDEEPRLDKSIGVIHRP